MAKKAAPKKPNPDRETQNKMILVPDTCSLIYLATPIPQSFFREDFPKDKRPERFIDLLLTPPKEKVKAIHVLDIVAAEVFGCDADGKIFDERYSPKQLQEGPPSKRRIVTELKVLRDSLFTKSPKTSGNTNGVKTEVVETEIGREQIELLKAQYDFLKQLESYCNRTNAKNKEQILQDERRHIRKLCLDLAEDRGEKVVIEYMDGYSNGPICFISDDRRAREDAVETLLSQSHTPANRQRHSFVTNAMGYLEALHSSGKLQEYGFKPDIDWQKVKRAIAHHEIDSKYSHETSKGKMTEPEKDYKRKTLVKKLDEVDIPISSKFSGLKDFFSR